MFSISGRAGSQLIRWENTVFDRFVIISESFRGDGLFHRSIRPSRTLHLIFNVSLIITLISYNNDAFVSCTFNTHTMITTHVSNIFIFLFQVGPLIVGSLFSSSAVGWHKHRATAWVSDRRVATSFASREIQSCGQVEGIRRQSRWGQWETCRQVASPWCACIDKCKNMQSPDVKLNQWRN